jgi:hypothetical protein
MHVVNGARGRGSGAAAASDKNADGASYAGPPVYRHFFLGGGRIVVRCVPLVPSFSDAVARFLISPENQCTAGTSLPIDSLATKGKKRWKTKERDMNTIHTPGTPVTDGVDIGWKIRHLAASIRNRENLLTFTGFATPHTPEAPAVIEERVAQQLAAIAAKRTELAYWEALAARTTIPTND